MQWWWDSWASILGMSYPSCLERIRSYTYNTIQGIKGLFAFMQRQNTLFKETGFKCKIQCFQALFQRDRTVLPKQWRTSNCSRQKSSHTLRQTGVYKAIQCTKSISRNEWYFTRMAGNKDRQTNIISIKFCDSINNIRNTINKFICVNSLRLNFSRITRLEDLPPCFRNLGKHKKFRHMFLHNIWREAFFDTFLDKIQN